MITRKQYTLASTAWANESWKSDRDPSLLEELIIDIAGDEGSFGLHLTWHDLGSIRPLTAMKLEAFDDAFLGVIYLKLLLVKFATNGLGRKNAAPPAEVIAFLDSMGFEPSEYHGQLARIKERQK